jgi:dephospho-CoA kinase
MYLIGLTGGIASGKSLVAQRLAEHGAILVDADVLAREVVEPKQPALQQIEDEFGRDVIQGDGSLDRQALGTIVFADPEARERLNGIIHPAVWRRAHKLFDQAVTENPDAVVVYDVPLLVEASAGREMEFDLVVVVHTDTATRLQRMIELRGMTRQEAMHRINSQASDTERLAVADVVIDNNGSVMETLRQVDELWERATASAHSKHRL